MKLQIYGYKLFSVEYLDRDYYTPKFYVLDKTEVLHKIRSFLCQGSVIRDFYIWQLKM